MMQRRMQGSSLQDAVRIRPERERDHAAWRPQDVAMPLSHKLAASSRMERRTFPPEKTRCFVLLFILRTLLDPTPTSALNDEGAALLEFGSRLNDTGGNLRGWNSSHSTPCRWTGVTCSKDKLHVVSISVPGKQLEGNLTLDVTRLLHLQALNLSSNGFRGAIPGFWGDSASLRMLDVSNNGLSGEIPQELNRLWNPVSVSFEGNDELCGKPTGRTCKSVRSLLEAAEPAAGASEAPAKKLSVGEIVAICISAFVVSKVTLFSIWCCRRRKMRRNCEVKLSGGRMIMFQLTGQVTPLSKAVLRKALKLKPQDIIGSGGYGTVYKLVLDDLSAFAVKKLTKSGLERDTGFERELQTLADVRHRNLVTLRGYYSAPEINLLVYDLMPNGNLETVLHDYEERNTKPIGWKLRIRIALGVARGLCYLHYDCVPHIIHRDIKCSNILLDANMEAHVGDFGLAKFINQHETHVTTLAAGTLGYLPPEYIETGKITEKGDVYSFGIVLLELLTGKRPNDDSFSDYDFNIVEWANALLEEGRPEDIFDEKILGTALDEDLLTALGVAVHCTDGTPKARPNMQQIVKTLERLHREEEEFFVCSSRNLSCKISSTVKESSRINVNSCPGSGMVHPCDDAV